MGGEGGVLDFFYGGNLNFFSVLDCTDCGGYVKCTPKYIIVGGEGGVSECHNKFIYLCLLDNLADSADCGGLFIC